MNPLGKSSIGLRHLGNRIKHGLLVIGLLLATTALRLQLFGAFFNGSTLCRRETV
jgi:hypothetical protein